MVKPGDINEISDLYPRFETYNRHFRKRQDELFNGVCDFSTRLELDCHVDEIIVCGHSAGETDREYFLRLSAVMPTATWTFTPFDEIGGQDYKNIARLTSDPNFSSGGYHLRCLANIIGE
jgi:hypothetical protein